MKTVFNLFLSFTLALSCLLVQAQSYNFLRYSVSDGLASSRVHAITQDKFGNLWIGTQGGGISKFNGKTFSNLTVRDGLASNFIRDLDVDIHGNIWAATAQGLTCITGDTILNYAVVAPEEVKTSVVSVQSRKDSTIWFSHQNGKLYFVHDDIISEYKTEFGNNSQIIDLKETDDGVLWGVTNRSDVFSIEDGVLKLQYQRESEGHFVLSLYVRENQVFLCTNEGVFSLHQDELLLSKVENVFVQQAIESDNGNVWFISTLGLMSADIDGVAIEYNGQKGFTDETVRALFKDKEGTLWFGTDGDGIYQLSGDTFTRWNTTNGLYGDLVTSVVRAKDKSLWFSTYGNGLSVISDNEVSNYSTSNSPISDFIICSARDAQGNLWFGTRNEGLIKYDGYFSSYRQEDGLVDNSIRCLYGDREGKMWIGSRSGLSVYDGSKLFPIKAPSELDEGIWHIGESDGIGLYVVTRNGLYIESEGEFRKESLPDSLFVERLNTIVHHPESGYWIGYSGYGILNFNPEKNISKYFTTDQGLSSDIIHSVLIDEKGDLLVGTDRGIDKIFLTPDGNTKLIKSYGNNDGFYGLHTILNSVFQDDDGTVWFGSSEGAYHYNPKKELINSIPPVTYISSMKLNYQETDWENYSSEVEPWTGIPKNLKLNYDENNLVFEFFGNSLVDPDKVDYQFRLENMERDWSPVLSNTEVAYSNLPPGKYTFMVKARNRDGIWNETPARVQLEIIPPFWQEWWFFLLVGFSIILSVIIINEYRINARLQKLLVHEKIREEEQSKVRSKMARDFHDNLGNQLASITVFTNLIGLKLKNRTKEIDGLLAGIEKHAQSLFNGTKDFIWSMDPSSDDLNEIFTYLRDFGEDLYDNSGIEFYADNSETENEKISLPSGSSRHVVLIFKEAMTNVLKHSKATNCHFTFDVREKHFYLAISDNGVGNAIESKGGNGLRNMEQRANEIGYELLIENKEPGMSICLKGKIESTEEFKIGKLKMTRK